MCCPTEVVTIVGGGYIPAAKAVELYRAHAWRLTCETFLLERCSRSLTRYLQSGKCYLVIVLTLAISPFRLTHSQPPGNAGKPTEREIVHAHAVKQPRYPGQLCKKPEA